MEVDTKGYLLLPAIMEKIILPKKPIFGKLRLYLCGVAALTGGGQA